MNNELVFAMQSTPLDRLGLDKEGNLYFSIVSDGTTKSEWVEEKLKTNKLFSPQLFKKLLKSIFLDGNFATTNGKVTDIVLIRQNLFECNYRHNRVICVGNTWRKLEMPSIEQSMLIMKKYTREEFWLMGFPWVMTMHDLLTSPGKDCSQTLVEGFRKNDLEVAFAFVLA